MISPAKSVVSSAPRDEMLVEIEVFRHRLKRRKQGVFECHTRACRGVLGAIVRLGDDRDPNVRVKDEFVRRPDDHGKIVRRPDDPARDPIDALLAGALRSRGSRGFAEPSLPRFCEAEAEPRLAGHRGRFA